MITDLLSNSNRYYPANKYFVAAIQFITDALTNEMSDGEYSLFSDDVFARVMTYSLKDRNDCRFESHREYVDIQAALCGSEGVEWMPVINLIPATEYDVNSDMFFYKQPEVAPAKIDVYPGSFVMFFPLDGHMPQLLTAENNAWVKKIVIKLRTSLFD